MDSKCITKPSLIGKQMSFYNFLTLFFFRDGVTISKARELAQLNMSNPYLIALYIQAYHETGGFTSSLYRNNYNMFGMKAPNSRHKYCDIKNGYAAYSHFVDGLADRILWDDQNNISVPSDISDIPQYYAQVHSKHYAEDPEYVAKLLHLFNVLKNTGYLDTVPDTSELDNPDDIMAQYSQSYSDTLPRRNNTNYYLFALLLPIVFYTFFKLKRFFKK